MIIKNFINGQITTGTEPIDPISGISRGLYINSVLSGNSSSDTLVGLDINPSYSGIAGNYFGLRVSGDTIFATSGGTQVFRTNNSGVAITGTLSNTTGAQFATSSGNVLIGTTTDAGYKLDVNGTGRFSGGIFQSMGTSSLNLLVAGTTSQTSDRGVFVGNGSFNNASVVGVALGYGLTLGTGTGNVAIGYTASASGGGIAISSTGLGASASGGGIAVGGGSSSTGGVAIGGTTNTSGAVGIKGSATAVNAVAINGTASGNFSLSIGDRCTASHTQSIAIGLGSKTSAVGDFVAGGYFPNGGYGIYNVYFGTGPQGDQTNEINGDSYAINGSGGFGTNKNGGNLTLAGGKGTGNGTPGDVIISTATSGSTGSTLQTLTTRLVVKANTGNVGMGTTSPGDLIPSGWGSGGRVLEILGSSNESTGLFLRRGNFTGIGLDLWSANGAGSSYIDNRYDSAGTSGVTIRVRTAGTPRTVAIFDDEFGAKLGDWTNNRTNAVRIDGDLSFRSGGGQRTITGPTNTSLILNAIPSSTSEGIILQYNGTTGLVFNNLGNVFIGSSTTDLGFKLSVSGSTLLRGSGTTSASYALATQNSSGGTTMVVNNAGNMLIGTTTDAGQRLQVNGSTRLIGGGSTSGTTGFTVVNSSNEVALQVLNNKWIGMQVLSPSAPLHVYYPGTTPQTKTIAIFDGYQSPAQPLMQIQVGREASNLGVFLGYDMPNSNGFIKQIGASSNALSWNDLSNVAIGGNATQNNSLTIYGRSYGSATSFNTTGIMFRTASGTLTVISNSTAIPDISVVGLGTQTIVSNVIGRDYGNVSNLYIDGPPVAGSNTTITNRWSMYVNSGNTYFGGRVMVGLTGDTGFQFTSSGSTLLRGSGTTSASYALATQNSSGGTTMVVNNAGNMLIGTTTDAGYRLDVNGAVRTGNLTVGASGQGQIIAGQFDFYYPNTLRYQSAYYFTIVPHTAGTTQSTGGYVAIKADTIQLLHDNYFSIASGTLVNSGDSVKLKRGTNLGHLPLYLSIEGADAAGYNYGTRSGSVLIYPGEQSFDNGYGSVVLAHNGINERGSVLIGTSTTNNSRLLVGGTVSGATLSTTRATHINATLLATGNTTTLIGLDIQPTFTPGSFTGLTQIALRVSGGTQIIGSGSTGTTLSLFSVDGASGRLFDVTDDFTNSLFSVNTSSGVPVIEAFANNSIVMGTYGSNALVVSGTSVSVGTNQNLARLFVKSSGTSTSNAFVVQNSSGGTISHMYDNGSATFGTSSNGGFKYRFVDENNLGFQITNGDAGGSTGRGTLIIGESSTNGRLVITTNTSIDTANIGYTYGGIISFSTGGTERMRLARNASNLLINTTTDSGHNLNVNGTSNFSGNMTLGGTATFGSTVVGSSGIAIGDGSNRGTWTVGVGYTVNMSNVEQSLGVGSVVPWMNNSISLGAGGYADITSSQMIMVPMAMSATTMSSGSTAELYIFNNTQSRLSIPNLSVINAMVTVDYIATCTLTGSSSSLVFNDVKAGTQKFYVKRWFINNVGAYFTISTPVDIYSQSDSAMSGATLSYEYVSASTIKVKFNAPPTANGSTFRCAATVRVTTYKD